MIKFTLNSEDASSESTTILKEIQFLRFNSKSRFWRPEHNICGSLEICLLRCDIWQILLIYFENVICAFSHRG